MWRNSNTSFLVLNDVVFYVWAVSKKYILLLFKSKVLNIVVGFIPFRLVRIHEVVV